MAYKLLSENYYCLIVDREVVRAIDSSDGLLAKLSLRPISGH